MRIGTKDYNIYANSQVPTPEAINDLPLKSVGNASVLVGDIGKAEDSGTIQTNIVRIDGQQSVYIPMLKQGGDSNTITIVDGMKEPSRIWSTSHPRSKPPSCSINRCSSSPPSKI